ncbi:HesA/MoeB/ThiF family protein [Demequina capsici]|uniref:HesA/MoeB/ThiF family protein n=1 Tax=Demequina capsici TaxID=3075620 RepID=A0AA96F8M0_9MICO|nr:HesA/MoeB/ThiF family protein [Demequina sp. OYTSA14]WNM25447.1 HesA/MoeB/ThiF family protein [Demequina sp. OYTSA14]
MADPFLRQRVLPGFGDEGQEALRGAHVAIVGMGGLGCPAAQYLATAGVGSLTLIDSDRVATSNLHRQILFGPEDVGRRKAEAAADALRRVAPWCATTIACERLTQDSGALLDAADLVVDGTDTWTSRRAVAAAARERSVPVVWGAVHGWYGQVTVFGGAVALHDVYPRDEVGELDRCEGQGVVGAVCGQIGTAMASRALAVLLGHDAGEGRLDHLDGRTGRWREVRVRSRARTHA